MDRICEYCGQSIGGLFLATLGGQAHKRCYLLRHPYRQARDFGEVLAGEDPALLRFILDDLIPSGLKAEIVDAYNAELLDRYKRALAGTFRVYSIPSPSPENTFDADAVQHWGKWRDRDKCAEQVRMMPGYDHFIWNGRIYSLTETGYRDSGYLASDFPELCRESGAPG